MATASNVFKISSLATHFSNHYYFHTFLMSLPISLKILPRRTNWAAIGKPNSNIICKADTHWMIVNFQPMNTHVMREVRKRLLHCKIQNQTETQTLQKKRIVIKLSGIGHSGSGIPL